MVTTLDRSRAALRALDTTLADSHVDEGSPTHRKAHALYHSARDNRERHEEALCRAVTPLTTKSGRTDADALFAPDIVEQQVLTNYGNELNKIGAKPRTASVRTSDAEPASKRHKAWAIGLIAFLVIFNLFALALLFEYWTTVSSGFRNENWWPWLEMLGFWVAVILYVGIIVGVNVAAIRNHIGRQNIREHKLARRKGK